MIEPRIVRRYASALFNAASSSGVVDAVESDLGLVSYTLESSPALMSAMTSPLLPSEKKEAVLRDLFADKVNPITLLYLNLLIKKRREEAMVATEVEYVRLANEARGMVQALVTSAIELDDEQQAKLAARLAQITGKKIDLEIIIDKSIIGGLMVRIGDKLIDGSIRGQLAALKEDLMR